MRRAPPRHDCIGHPAPAPSGGWQHHLLMASLTPSPRNTAPDARLSLEPADGFSRRRRLMAEPNQASTRHQIVPVVMNSAPRSKIARILKSADGATNCGRNAMKKSAALGLSQLERLDKLIEKRTQLANLYHKHFAAYQDIIQLPGLGKNNTHTWFVYVIKLKKGAKGKWKK